MHNVLAVGRNSGISVGRDALGNVFVTGDDNTVTVVVADTRLQAAAVANLENPYRGLDAFRESDSALFFGRDDLMRRLWTKFHALQRGHVPRVLPVLGPSGSGKSSLVRAGLLPELVRQPMEGMRNPTVLVLRPGADPLHRLADVLARLTPTGGTAPTTLEPTPSPDLVHRAAQRAGDADHRVVIFVDQLEELFTECTSEPTRSTFLTTLAHAAAQPDRWVSVVFAMRNDFVGALRTHEAFAAAVREPFRVSQMSKEQLVEAIDKPAQVLGHPWPIGLVENLVLQCEGRAGALPLLQFALKRLWSEHLAGRLAASGRSSQLIEDFVVQVADTLYEGSGAGRECEAHQRIIRRAFVAMVQLGEGAADTRRVAPLSEIVARRETHDEVRAVLAPFTTPEARLVTVSEDSGEPTYELTHEVLIGSWDRLSTWLGNVPDKAQAEAIRSEVRLRRRLGHAAAAWCGDQEALLRPPELGLVAVFRDRAPDELSKLESEFIDASLAAWESSGRWRRRALVVIGALSIVLATALVIVGFFAIKFRDALESTEREKAKTAEALTLAEMQRRAAREAELEAQGRANEISNFASFAFERLAHLDFDRDGLDEDVLAVIVKAVETVRSMSKRRIRLIGHVGQFCDADSEMSPIDRCRYRPETEEYAIALAARFAGSVRSALVRANIPPDDVEVLPRGIMDPRVNYPTKGTAADWNKVARVNNRIELQFVSGP